ERANASTAHVPTPPSPTTATRAAPKRARLAAPYRRATPPKRRPRPAAASRAASHDPYNRSIDIPIAAPRPGGPPSLLSLPADTIHTMAKANLRTEYQLSTLE